jgi:hypothetical protein
MSQTVGSPASGERKPWLLGSLGLVLLLANTVVAGALAPSPDVAMMLGAMCGPTMLTLAVVGCAMLVPGARTTRGVVKVAVVTLAVIAFSQCSRFGQRIAAKARARSDPGLARIVAETSQSLPWQVDEETEAFAVALDGDVLVYSYRLVNRQARDVAPQEVEALGTAARRHACRAPQSRVLLSRGIAVRHVFHDKDRAILGSITVRPTDCPSPS